MLVLSASVLPSVSELFVTANRFGAFMGQFSSSSPHGTSAHEHTQNKAIKAKARIVAGEVFACEL
jgi:hypothetical protein